MFATINGVRLHVKLLGTEAPDKPVMIAHHGAPGLSSLAYNSSRVSVDRAKFERIMNGMLKDDEDFADCWREILPLYLHEYDPELIERRVRNAKYRYRTHNHVFSVVHKQYDIRDQLHKIRCPTLVLVGRSDWITPVEYSEFIAEQIPGAKLVVFEKSGHSPQIEEPEKFQRVVREFLVANV